MTEKLRLQFDFTPEALEEVDRLKVVLRASSRAEVVRFALRVLQWVTGQLSDDGVILVRRAGKTQEVVFPFLKPTPKEETRAKVSVGGLR